VTSKQATISIHKVLGPLVARSRPLELSVCAGVSTSDIKQEQQLTEQTHLRNQILTGPRVQTSITHLHLHAHWQVSLLRLLKRQSPCPFLRDASPLLFVSLFCGHVCCIHSIYCKCRHYAMLLFCCYYYYYLPCSVYLYAWFSSITAYRATGHLFLKSESK
jgi:hypothetical protein